MVLHCSTFWKYLYKLENCILLLIVSIPVLYYFQTIVYRQDFEYVVTTYLGYFCFIIQFPCILLGIVAFHMHNITDKLTKTKNAIGDLCVVVAIISLMLGNNLFLVCNEVTTWGICFTLLLLFQLEKTCFLFRNTVVRLFGKYSYGIYFLHYTLIRIMNVIFGGVPDTWKILMFMATCIISLGVSIIADRIQKEFQKRILIRTDRTISSKKIGK